MTTYALIASIESDRKNLNQQTNTTTIDRMYEQEAVKCFQAWRENGGWLKDIPIYVMCVTSNTISQSTKDALVDLGVVYTEEYHAITETFTSGFLTIPYVGKLYEQRLTEDVLIKIDLDMNLIQPLPTNWFSTPTDVICGQYDDYCTKTYQRVANTGHNPFDTGLMISNRMNRVYDKWFSLIYEFLDGSRTDSTWNDIRSLTGEYYLEEFVMDYMYTNNICHITPMQKYQLGEWYTPVAEYTDEELSSIYFWHEHAIRDSNYDTIRQRVEFFNRMKRICR